MTVAMKNPEHNWNDITADLKKMVDTRFVIDDRESIKPYECDGLSVYREMPRIVVIPESTAEVSSVLR